MPIDRSRSLTKHIALLTLVAGLLLTGCASVYRQTGVESAGASVAVIEAEPCEGMSCLTLQEIDGKFRGVGWFKRYELLPGKRVIKFIFNSPGVASQSGVLVEFEALAGHTYGIHSNANRKNMTWAPEVYDKSNGAVVSKRTGTAPAY